MLMPRPPTPEDQRRSFHTTINLTQSERKALETIGQGVPITKLAVTAIQDFIAKEMSSYICDQGHTFCLEYGSLKSARCCPICESKAIQLQRQRRYV